MNRKSECPHRSGRGGYTLSELLIVLVIAAIVAAMALPRFYAAIRQMSGRSAVSYVVSDLALARTQAVREGRTVSLRVVSPTEYRVTLDQGVNVVRTIKTVKVQGGQRDVSLWPDQTRFSFDPRGMLRADSDTRLLVRRTTRTDTISDTISVSAVGRVYRGN